MLDLSGGLGFNPYWLKMTPTLVTANFCPGVGREGKGKERGKGREGEGKDPQCFLDKSNPGIA